MIFFKLLRILKRKRVTRDPLSFEGLNPHLAKMLSYAEAEIVELTRENAELRAKYETET
jgi:hypothetical protein